MHRFSQLDDTYGLMYSNTFVVNSKSQIIDESYMKETPPVGHIFEELLAHNYIPALTVIIPRKVLDTLGKFDTEIMVEDWEYWLRIAQKYKMDCIEEPIAYYRMHDSNISHNKKKTIIACWQILMKYATERKHRKIVNRFAVKYLYNKSLQGYGVKLYRQYRYKHRFILNALKFRFTRALLKQLIKIEGWYS